MKKNDIYRPANILRIIFSISFIFYLFYSKINAQIDYSKILSQPGMNTKQSGEQESLIEKYKKQQESQLQSEARQKETLKPSTAPEEKGKPELSSIEKMYQKRYGENKLKPLLQYGYNFFDYEISRSFMSVSEDYKVGPGDTLSIYFWGDPVDILGLNGFYTLQIDRDGKIFIPNIGVFYVWGMELPKIKDIIYRAINKKFKSFSIEVALGEIRNFPVYVSGFINKPGIVLTTGANNIVDILTLAGGIDKSGSLRNITIKRQDKNESTTIDIDLYDLMISGKPLNIKINQGDAICVNPVEKTAGIAGGVKRPAIYELKNNADSIEDLLKVSGGCLASARSPQVKLIQFIDNKIQIITGNLADTTFLKKQLSDGDLLVIEDLYNIVDNAITVNGHVSYPGNYAYKAGMKLSDIIKDIGILPDTNIYTAGIIREKTNKGINFIPENILSGKSDIELQSRDIVNFYPKWMYKPIEIMGEIKNPSVVPYYENITIMDVLHDIEFSDDVKYLKADLYWEMDSYFEELPGDVKLLIYNSLFRQKEPAKKPTSDDTVIITSRTQQKFNKDNETEKNQPKEITMPDNSYISIYLVDLLVKVTKESNIVIPPGARILITKTTEIEKRPAVTMMGEISQPGVYSARKGDTLYDYIKRAGGYTQSSYPRGIILVRQSARKLQEEHIQMTFLSMEESLSKQNEALSMTGSTQEESMMLQFVLSKYKQSIDLLKKKSELAMGRMSLDIPMELEELKSSSENIELIDGDYIFIPHKPNYILVLGEVYNQMTLPYEESKTVTYYLNQLGNVTQNANEEEIYIIKANGKIISKRQFSSFFDLYFSFDWDKKRINFVRNFEDLKLEQGDTIVVPTELKIPTMWRPILKDIVQILFQSMSTVIMATKIY